jgi:hypothetical protein
MQRLLGRYRGFENRPCPWLPDHVPRKTDTGVRKRSCSIKYLEHDDNSTETHRALAERRARRLFLLLAMKKAIVMWA